MGDYIKMARRENQINRYCVVRKIIDVIEFDDEEMRDFDYSGYITDEMREEFLMGLIENEYDPKTYDDIEITKMEVDD